MNSALRYCISFSCFLWVFGFASLWSQSVVYKKGAPPDLNTSKIIFLKFDSLDLPVAWKDWLHLRNVPVSNAQAEKAVGEYPFEYILAYRRNIPELVGQGYKYKLDFEPSQPMYMPMGRAIGDGGRELPLYVENLLTGERWEICEISETFSYYSKGLITKFSSKVRKQFGVK